MRRIAFAMSAVLAFAVLANPADAQIKLGVHVAMISGVADVAELDGTFGVGARAGIQAPALPIGVFASATYFNPDCTDCGYWTGSLFGKVGLPLVMVSPYLLGGIQRRASSFGTLDMAENGPFVGLGVQLQKLFIEATMEFNEDDPAVPDFDNDPLVFKAGILIG
jgi:hypothetical protein